MIDIDAVRFRREIAETIYAVVHDGAKLSERLVYWRAKLTKPDFEIFESLVRRKLAILRPETGVLYWFMDEETVQQWIDKGRPI